MTADEFKTFQAKMKLDNREIAIRMGVSLSSIEGWRIGRTPVPAMAAKLAGYMQREMEESCKKRS